VSAFYWSASLHVNNFTGESELGLETRELGGFIYECLLNSQHWGKNLKADKS
jgi:hypothetical protein